MVGETTVNVGVDIAARIALAAAERGVSRRDVVSSLLNYASRRMKVRDLKRVLVKYQERRPGGEWKRLHVVVRKDEHGFFTDLRKLHLMSLSYIIAYAVEHYLDKMLDEMKGSTDNYRYRNYAIIHFPVEDVTCWLLCWGIHPAMAKNLPPKPS